MVEDLEQVEEWARDAERQLVVIFDADNTVVPDGAPSGEFAERVNRLIDRFEVLPAVERVIVLTNGPPRGVERIISRGNKPLTGRRRLGLAGTGAEVWVVGDQILTDGLLAWRLGAVFIHQAIAESGERPLQAVLRAVGATVGRLFLEEADRP